MSVILCSSLLLRILTALWSLMVLFWFRDLRILLLTAMLILMAIRQGCNRRSAFQHASVCGV